MSDGVAPPPQSPQWLARPRRLLSSAFRGSHDLGLRVVGLGRILGHSFIGVVRWLGWRSLKGLENLFLRHRTSRRATKGTVKGSAVTTGSIPTGGSQTSAGASANVQEILQIIDDSLQDGISEGAWARVTDGLEEVTEAIANSQVPEEAKYCNFFRSRPGSPQLLQLAAKCSKAAYENNNITSRDQLEAPFNDSTFTVFDVAEEISKASLDGTIKASMITYRTAVEDHIIVFAIRGTVSLVDWLVNLDGDLEPTDGFLSFEGEEPIKAHRGLLRVAKGMLSLICSRINSELQALLTTAQDNKTSAHLLFTGHSAGGGVAALMCAHIRNHCPEIVQGFRKIHCITFAAPPVLAPLHAVSTDLNEDRGFTINIVNNGDIVPRAEKNYIRSLLQLYKARTENPLANPSEFRWDFGEPSTFNYGQIFILKDTSADEDERSEVHAYNVLQDLWQTLAFGSVRAHPMNVYVQAVEDFASHC